MQTEMTQQDRIFEIKDLRKTLDSMIKGYHQLNSGGFSSDALSQSGANLKKAVMYLGKILGEMGFENPYPDSSNPASNAIEPMADEALREITFGDPSLTVLGKIKTCRGIIQEMISKYRELLETAASAPANGSKKRSDIELYAQQWFICMTEAKMWLGVELSNLRKQ